MKGLVKKLGAPLVMVLVVFSVMFNNYSLNATQSNLNGLGSANVNSIEQNDMLELNQVAFTPVMFVLMTPETPAAAGALVLVGAYALHTLGSETEQSIAMNEANFVDYRIAQLD